MSRLRDDIRMPRFRGLRAFLGAPIRVLEIGACIAGFIAFTAGWVNHLYVAPDHWGRGHGSTLLGSAKVSAESLQLWTFQGNHLARLFYAKHGFLEAELTGGQRNEEKMPDVRLTWTTK